MVTPPISVVGVFGSVTNVLIRILFTGELSKRNPRTPFNVTPWRPEFSKSELISQTHLLIAVGGPS